MKTIIILPMWNTYPNGKPLPSSTHSSDHLINPPPLCIQKRNDSSTQPTALSDMCRNHNQNRSKANLKRLEFYHQRTMTVPSSLLNRTTHVYRTAKKFRRNKCIHVPVKSDQNNVHNRSKVDFERPPIHSQNVYGSSKEPINK